MTKGLSERERMRIVWKRKEVSESPKEKQQEKSKFDQMTLYSLNLLYFNKVIKAINTILEPLGKCVLVVVSRADARER